MVGWRDSLQTLSDHDLDYGDDHGYDGFCNGNGYALHEESYDGKIAEHQHDINNRVDCYIGLNSHGKAEHHAASLH